MASNAQEFKISNGDSNVGLFPIPQFVNVQKENGLQQFCQIEGGALILLATNPPEVYPIAKKLKDFLETLGISTELLSGLGKQDSGAKITFYLRPLTDSFFTSLSPPILKQSYQISIDDKGIILEASEQQGLFYAVCTLQQLITIHHKKTESKLSLPALQIKDYPHFQSRGVMVDISRDKVPKLETLKSLIVQLSEWKINQFQLYMEHTFKYRGHETVWKDASPITAEDILALDALCKSLFIELVPNQNSFGHMERWLVHEPYKHLAECPTKEQPFSLCPTDPRSLQLLEDLYNQLLPNFSSKQFNVGLDETFDLGAGRSNKLCLENGTENVYVEFLQKVYELVKSKGYRMQFWGDIVLSSPAVIPKLPKEAVPLIWGYENHHPFETQCPKFVAAGIKDFYVCPGTSSWNTLTGRTKNAIGNLRNAAVNGHATGAEGYLITDWGDNGHFQTYPISMLGFFVGSGFSWNAKKTSEKDFKLTSLLDTFVFRDESGLIGKLLYDLGNVYLQTGEAQNSNGTLYGRIAYFCDYNLDLQGFSKEKFEKSMKYIDEVMQPLRSIKMDRPDSQHILDEIQLGADMARFSAKLCIERFDLSDRKTASIAKEKRNILAKELEDIIDRYKKCWLVRNREGGLKDSVGRLEATLKNLQG